MDDTQARDTRSQRERMIAGDLYRADDPELVADMRNAMRITEEYNALAYDEGDRRHALLEELVEYLGEGVEIRAPFRCDYGYHLRIGARTFVSFGLVALDVSPIVIGEDVQIGPNVQLLTAIHPLEPGPRREKWECGRPIVIGDNVWLGGGAIVCAGVTIGENTVVGA